jgi:hypothetical protein
MIRHILDETNLYMNIYFCRWPHRIPSYKCKNLTRTIDYLQRNMICNHSVKFQCNRNRNNGSFHILNSTLLLSILLLLFHPEMDMYMYERQCPDFDPKQYRMMCNNQLRFNILGMKVNILYLSIMVYFHIRPNLYRSILHYRDNYSN